MKVINKIMKTLNEIYELREQIDIITNSLCRDCAEDNCENCSYDYEGGE